MWAMRELWWVLVDAAREAYEAADLRRRIGAWWWVVRHHGLVEGE